MCILLELGDILNSVSPSNCPCFLVTCFFNRMLLIVTTGPSNSLVLSTTTFTSFVCVFVVNAGDALCVLCVTVDLSSFCQAICQTRVHLALTAIVVSIFAQIDYAFN